MNPDILTTRIPGVFRTSIGILWMNMDLTASNCALLLCVAKRLISFNLDPRISSILDNRKRENSTSKLGAVYLVEAFRQEARLATFKYRGKQPLKTSCGCAPVASTAAQDTLWACCCYPAQPCSDRRLNRAQRTIATVYGQCRPPLALSQAAQIKYSKRT